MNNYTSIDFLIIIIAIVILFVMALFIPRIMARSSMKKVIKTMINNKAVDRQSALTAEQLGFKQGTAWENVFSMRDYRPQALSMLVDSELVVKIKDNRYFLSLEKLKLSKFKDLYRDAQ